MEGLRIISNELFAARQASFKSDGRFLVSHCCDLALLFGGVGELGDGMLITVGDATTQKMMQYGIVPSVQIVDGTEKRARRDLPDRGLLRTRIRCSNPPGGITEEAITAIGEALASPKPSRILVDGEEDLLVLPVCTSAPLGSTVMYGQPNEGLVVVHVSAQ